MPYFFFVVTCNVCNTNIMLRCRDNGGLFAICQYCISDLIYLYSVCTRRLFFCLNRFAIPHQPIRGTLARSVDRSVVPSAAQSIARSLGRSFGRSISRSIHLPLTVSPSPYLVFPRSFPAYLTLRSPHLDLLIGTIRFICFECSKMHSASFVF